MEKYGFVYIWFDKKRKMYYIGSHWGTTDDGYICSSNRMRDAYRRRPEDFKRRIIETNIIDKNSLRKEEDKFLKLAEKKKQKYYNHKYFSICKVWSWENLKFSKDHKIKLGNLSRGKKWFTDGMNNMFCFEGNQGNNFYYGRTLSEDHKEKVSKGNFKGKRHSNDAKLKISLAGKKKQFSEEYKLKISAGVSNAWATGKGKYKNLKK